MPSPPSPAVVPLPRGRHNLSSDVVRESQRERVLTAILESVHQRGLVATTVADVVRGARVSRTAFYRLYPDKETCFLAACDRAFQGLLDELYSLGAERHWVDALREGVHRYLAWWQRNPGYAVVYLVELPKAGSPAIEQRDRTYAAFADMFRSLADQARQDAPDLPELGALVPRVLVTSITEIVAQETRQGRLAELHQLERELTFLIVKLLADDRTAALAVDGA